MNENVTTKPNAFRDTVLKRKQLGIGIIYFYLLRTANQLNLFIIGGAGLF